MAEQKINPVTPITPAGNVLKKKKQADKKKTSKKPDQSKRGKRIIDTYA